jgi:P27 family predicted phage terminase small subunit
LLRGNPGRRPINANEPQPEIPAKPPAPPAFLDDYARDEWKRVAPELHRLGLLTKVDTAALAAYRGAFSQWKTAVETMRRLAGDDQIMKGLLVRTPGGATVNPLIWIVKGAARDMVRYAAEFGMTPASRPSIVGDDRGPDDWGGLLRG